MKLDYKIIYSNRKTLTISVERDRTIIVHAPEKTSKEKINQIIEKKKLWIYDKINHEQKFPENPQKSEYVSGESILYLGRNYKLQIVKKEIQGLLFDSTFYISKTESLNAQKLIKEWFVNRAKDLILPKAIYYSKRIGVNFKEAKISEMKYRWGSCTIKNNINFNWRIIKAPMYVVEYIIVHELTHLRETNHTPEFWNIVAVQLPEYLKAKEWLKMNGESL
jgi:predicted metal-dependent hydrolase